MMNLIKLALLFLVAAAVTVPANGTAILTLNDGVDPIVTVMDQGVGDLSPTVGAVTFSGAIGNWTINVTTGITTPVIGSASSPQMDLSSVNVTSTGGGVLTIVFSEDGFLTSGLADATIGGTLAEGSLSYTTFADGSVLTTQNFINSGSGDLSFSGSKSASFVASSYTLDEEVVISHKSAGVTSFDATVNVTTPEPNSAILLGTALAGIVCTIRRKLLA